MNPQFNNFNNYKLYTENWTTGRKQTICRAGLSVAPRVGGVAK